MWGNFFISSSSLDIINLKCLICIFKAPKIEILDMIYDILSPAAKKANI